MAQHKPAQIELRKKICENSSNLASLKHRSFGGASQASVAMMRIPSMLIVDPQNPSLISAGAIGSFRRSSGFGAARLDKDEDFRFACKD